MKRLYTPREVSNLTGLKRETITRWFRKGRVEGAMKIGLGKQAPWHAPSDAIMKCLVDHGWRQESPFAKEE